MLKYSAWLAVATGAAVAGAEIVRNYDNLQNWDTWMIDVAANAMLLGVGVITLRGASDRFLPAAWAFVCALYLTSILGQRWLLEHTQGADHDRQVVFVSMIGVLVVTSLVGLALSLTQRKTA